MNVTFAANLCKKGCKVGFWRKGIDCKNAECAACPKDHFCDGIESHNCSTVCAQDEFLRIACNSTLQGVCEKCTDGFWCNGVNITSCSTECERSNYIAINCSNITDALCRECTSCTAGSYILRNCTLQGDTVCAECESGFFCPGFVSRFCLPRV